ncbi:inositol monophosphatase family protein [Streptomyces sp. NPDC004267]|uniref:inositol monophosphatase family protein n=1 Tax=Streptomyces sp. NPDC004267 TaxID=3364694 RepID=UPI0036B92EC6
MITTFSRTDDAEVAVTAALAGAAVVRDLYGGRLDRIDKGGGDFATAADLAAERAILDVIRAARPKDALLGEEGGEQGAAGAGRQWLVDPLCGTLNYAAGTQVVAVNVALRDGTPEGIPDGTHEGTPGGTHEGTPGGTPGGTARTAVAAVADPFGGEVLWTDGERAWARRDGADTPLVPSGAVRLVDVNLDPPFPNAPGFRAVDLLAHPGFVAGFRPRVVSSTLAVAWVAAGRRAAYVTDGGDLSGSVHFAAGIALCRAAGCVVTGIDGRPPGPAGHGLVVAADAATHAELMALIRR